jgi:hypothetical protein
VPDETDQGLAHPGFPHRRDHGARPCDPLWHLPPPRAERHRAHPIHGHHDDHELQLLVDAEFHHLDHFEQHVDDGIQLVDDRSLLDDHHDLGHPRFDDVDKRHHLDHFHDGLNVFDLHDIDYEHKHDEHHDDEHHDDDHRPFRAVRGNHEHDLSDVGVDYVYDWIGSFDDLDHGSEQRYHKSLRVRQLHDDVRSELPGRRRQRVAL